MDSAPSAVKNPDLMVIMMLARLLEKLDQSPVAADPGQYRSVVLSLSRVLLQASSNPALEPLLRAHPSAAQLYEQRCGTGFESVSALFAHVHLDSAIARATGIGAVVGDRLSLTTSGDADAVAANAAID